MDAISNLRSCLSLLRDIRSKIQALAPDPDQMQQLYDQVVTVRTMTSVLSAPTPALFEMFEGLFSRDMAAIERFFSRDRPWLPRLLETLGRFETALASLLETFEFMAQAAAEVPQDGDERSEEPTNAGVPNPLSGQTGTEPTVRRASADVVPPASSPPALPRAGGLPPINAGGSAKVVPKS